MANLHTLGFFSGIARFIDAIETVSDIIGMIKPIGLVVVVACAILGIGALIKAFRSK